MTIFFNGLLELKREIVLRMQCVERKGSAYIYTSLASSKLTKNTRFIIFSKVVFFFKKKKTKQNVATDFIRLAVLNHIHSSLA